MSNTNTNTNTTGNLLDQNPMNQNSNNLLDSNIGMLPQNTFVAASGPQTQYSLDGMMGGNVAPSANNLLDQMGGMMNQQVNSDLIVLNDVSELDSERFQQLWMQLPVGCGGQALIKPLRNDMQFTVQVVENKFKENKLQTMASGQMGNELKFFFHCQLADKSGFFMIESLFNI